MNDLVLIALFLHGIALGLFCGWMLWRKPNLKYKVQDEFCPTCGYYCLGKGGIGCIDKPSMMGETK